MSSFCFCILVAVFSSIPCLFVAVSGVSVQNDNALAKDDATPIVIIIPGLTSDSASPVSHYLQE